MRKTILCLLSAAFVPLTGASIAAAQDNEPPNFIPVEMAVCKYRDGKDRSDLDDAMEEMTDWMSENDAQPYAARVLEKWFAGPEQDFDYLYIGAWPNGEIMGRDMAQYTASADDAIAANVEVADCYVNVLFASLQIKSLPDDAEPNANDFVVSISDCTVAENRSAADAVEAMTEYANYRTANGSPGGTFVWFPAYGPGGGAFDFKLVNAHANYEAFGNYYKWVVDNAAYQTSARLFDGLVDCDVPRTYTGDTVVNTFPTN